jgi:DNA repair protein RecO (recombination protein O)
MLQTTRAIVIRTVRYADQRTILKAYTEQAGMRSYVVRTGKRGTGTQAALQALNRVELVADDSPDRDLHVLRELRVAKPYTTLPYDPVRGTIALFVQELLYKVLREEAADATLYAFLEEALEVMDTVADVTHFPLLFLLQLSGHLGFLPEAPAPGEDRFDLKEGHFMRGGAQHGHTLGPPLSHALAALLEVPLDGLPQPRIPTAQRRDLLDHLLLYYRLHLEGMGEMRSPAVLHQVLT